MPSCTGNPSVSSLWVCPYCKPTDSPISCHTLHNYDSFDDSKGQAKIECQGVCTVAGFRAASPVEFWEHMNKAHDWDGRLPEPPRLLPLSIETNHDDSRVQRPRGPNKATRDKARRKRKKKRR